MNAPPLAPLRPTGGGLPEAGAVLEAFLAACAGRGLELYPEQEEAILELYEGANVILNTPTGSGKSLVAAAFHYRALCRGERTVYTCPIKALVNEKFLSLCREFGPAQVGMMTGDASVNPGAPLLCCTAEILANIALHRGETSDLRAVVMDEFHYYSDPARGGAWQIPLLTMPHARFLLMSATLGETAFFEREMTRVTGAPSRTVRSDRRPVPLEFEYSETPLAERVAELLATKRAPIYLVHFTQRSAAEAAQALMSLNVCSREEKAALQGALESARFNSPHGREVQRWLRHGIGVHHAGLLPKYRLLVEKLAQQGLLKVICGTDTLGVGINVPIRTVLFTQLWKYDGKKAAVLTVRDFRQISGRAGRKGYDDRGFVVVQAPPHVIENRRAEEKAAASPGRRAPPKQRAPEGTIAWDERTLERLRTAPPEALTSRFEVSHGMLLLMLSRPGDGCRDLQRLLRECHETPHRQRLLRQRAWQLFRALVERGIVAPRPRGGSGPKLQVNVELQDDFSLHQALSLYLIDTLPRLDPEDPDHALNLLTLCEAIVEDPDAILRRQVDRQKSAKLEELRAAGVPYEERMERLEEIEHPKPLREFLYETFNAFAAQHPWVEQENVRPKSIAREMYERYLSFAAYVREYELHRVEGVLLRHLAQVWKVLAQTVPDTAKTEAVREVEDYLGELIRGVDSSLLEEWELLVNPAAATPRDDREPAAPARSGRPDVTRDQPSFRRLVRAALLGVLQDVALRDWEGAAQRLGADAAAGSAGDAPGPSPARRVEQAFLPYLEARGRLRLDPEGRSAQHTHWTEGGQPGSDEPWTVAQTLVDSEGLNDWEAVFTVAIPASRAAGRVVLELAHVGPIGGPAPG